MIDREEQIAVLYALHQCGGKGSKGRIIQTIIQNGLMKPREGDTERRENNEKKVENDLAWARADLKKQGWLSMPRHGFWQITPAGRDKLLRVAEAIYLKRLDEYEFVYDRLNAKFLGELRELGQRTAGGESV